MATAYWELLTPERERDVLYAFENARFSDYTLEVIVTGSDLSSGSYPLQQLRLAGAGAPAEPGHFTTVSCDGPEADGDHCSSDGGSSSPHDSAASDTLEPAGSPGVLRRAIQYEAGAGSSPIAAATSTSGMVAWDEAGEPDRQVFRIPFNSVVVSSRSLYFREALASGMYAKTRVLPLELDRRELPSFMLALRWLYGGEPRYEATPLPELVQLLLVADRLQAPSLVKETIQHLERRPLNTEAGTLVLSLPARLKPLLGYLLASVADFVQARFGHLDLVAKDEKLRSQFCSLPLPAVETVLYSPTVTVRSEDTAFQLLQAWADAQELEAEEFEQPPIQSLLGALRYAFMSPEFLSETVTSSAFMQGSHAHKLINEGTVFRTAPPSYRERLSAEADHLRFQQRPHPPLDVLEVVDPEAAKAAAPADPELEPQQAAGFFSMFSCMVWGHPTAAPQAPAAPSTPPAATPGKVASLTASNVSGNGIIILADSGANGVANGNGYANGNARMSAFGRGPGEVVVVDVGGHARQAPQPHAQMRVQYATSAAKLLQQAHAMPVEANP